MIATKERPQVLSMMGARFITVTHEDGEKWWKVTLPGEDNPRYYYTLGEAIRDLWYMAVDKANGKV